MWAHRIMLETNLHQNNAFVTLTYADEKLPRGKPISPEILPLSMLTSALPTSDNKSVMLPSLAPKDLQDWLKRLRKEIAPSKIRYYACGEYGDETSRPHYHLALFGYPRCVRGNSSYTTYRQNCCSHCDLIRDTWKQGQVYVGELSINSAQYVAGYVTKKLTAKDDPRLLGRHPEFGRMSLKPGIGADFMHEVASAILTHGALDEMDDVPSALQHGGRKLPLGRHLRRSLRKLVGRDEKTPDIEIAKLQEELRPMREAAFNGSRSFKTEVVKEGDQKVLNQETKAKIFKQRRTL